MAVSCAQSRISHHCPSFDALCSRTSLPINALSFSLLLPTSPDAGILAKSQRCHIDLVTRNPQLVSFCSSPTLALQATSDLSEIENKIAPAKTRNQENTKGSNVVSAETEFIPLVIEDDRDNKNVPRRLDIKQERTSGSARGRFSSYSVPAVSHKSNASNAPVGVSGRLPINLELDIYRAKCLFRERKTNEAEAILRQCIKEWPTDGKAYVCLATRLMKQNRFMDARTVLEDGCQATRGENAYIWQTWAVLEEKEGHISQSCKLFDAAIVADERHAAAWHGWAVLELRLGNIRKARELLSKGIKYCGANEYLYQTLALIEYKARNIEQARGLFNQAVFCNSKSCASWVAWALMEAGNSNISAARFLFQRGIRASPKNRYAWQAWALFEANQGKKDLARQLFEQGSELNPQDAVVLQAFALFEYNCQNPTKARKLFQQAASLQPKHQPIWLAWGWMEWKEGNLDTARLYYKKSLSIDGNNMNAARCFHAWASLEARSGNTPAARELYKNALRVDSQNRAAWMSLANLEESLGNLARAEEIRNQYLQQRTEVVHESPWDMNISTMLEPAINKIKSLLKMDTAPRVLVEPIIPSLDMGDSEVDEQFDIDEFIKEVLPWKRQAEIDK